LIVISGFFIFSANMCTIHLNPHFVIPPNVKAQNECLHAGEPYVVYVYRDVRYLKLELMSSRDVQEMVTVVVNKVGALVIGLLGGQELPPKKVDKIEMDASYYITTEILDRIGKFEFKRSTANPKSQEFYDRQIQLLREFEPFFQSFFEKHTVFHSNNTEAEMKEWKKDVVSQLYQTVSYGDSQAVLWGKGIPPSVFLDNQKLRMETYLSFKKEGFRCVQHPNAEDRVWYAAGKSTLVGVMQENGRILSELGDHGLFDIPLEYGREAIFFRKSQATLF